MSRFKMNRREVIKAATILPGSVLLSRASAVFAARSTNIRIVEVRHAFEDFKYRAPYSSAGEASPTSRC